MKTTALSISVGILGMISTLMTATVWNLPIWALFLAWASFFVVGTGLNGLLASVACNWMGIAIGATALLAVHGTSSALLTSVVVGVGSFAVVQASRLPWISVAPAIVLGFAMTAGIVAATQNPITTPGLSNPALIAATTAAVGAVFGIASEWGASALGRILIRD